MSTPKQGKPTKTASRGLLPRGSTDSTRAHRRNFLMPDAIEALYMGSPEERLEAAGIVRALADISDQHRMAMLSSGVLNALLACTAVNMDVTIRCAAFKALAALSTNDSVRQEFKRVNGIPQLMTMVSFQINGLKDVPLEALNDSDSMMLELTRAAIQALSVQTNNAQSKVVIREGQGIGVMIQALKTLPSDDEVRLSVCEALSSLSQDPGSRFPIYQAGGIKSICDVIHSQPPSKVILACLQALTSLSRVEEIAKFFEQDHIKEVINCIGGSPDLEKNMWACQVICNLAVNPSLKTFAVQSGATDKLCDLIAASAPDIKRSTGWAMKGLANLSSMEASKKTFLEKKTAKPMVQLFKGIAANIYSDDLPAVIRIINNVATIQDCRVQIYEAGATQLLIQLVNMRDVHLLKPSLFALSLLCDHTPVQVSVCKDSTALSLLTDILAHGPETSSLAACILAKCAKSDEGAGAMAKPQIINTLFHTIHSSDDEKTAAWVANCVTNISVKYSDQLLELSPDVLVNIMSILVRPGLSLDTTVWLVGALTEMSRVDSAVTAFVEMKGLTLTAQFISTSNDGQVIEMAVAILKNVAKRYNQPEEFSVQGVIRPLVHLLGISLEKTDLENSINAVRCMEAISVDSQNCQAMRKTGAVPLLVKLLGNQVGCSFVDLESEAARTLTNIATNDRASLDILRQAGAIPNLLSMLSVAVYGVNKYHIPRAAHRAIECLTAVADGHEKNRKAILNSSNFHAIESLRKRDLELGSEAVTDALRPLLVSLQLPSDWLALSQSILKKKGKLKKIPTCGSEKFKLKKSGTMGSEYATPPKSASKKAMFADDKHSASGSGSDSDTDSGSPRAPRFSDDGNILDKVPKHPWEFSPRSTPPDFNVHESRRAGGNGAIQHVHSFPVLFTDDGEE